MALSLFDGVALCAKCCDSHLQRAPALRITNIDLFLISRRAPHEKSLSPEQPENKIVG
ncbi:MAG TPA: hypothetical protein VGF97_18040 [Rhizomicrobium sp.]